MKNYRLDISYIGPNGRINRTDTWVVTAPSQHEAALKATTFSGGATVVVTVREQANDDGFDNGCQ